MPLLPMRVAGSRSGLVGGPPNNVGVKRCGTIRRTTAFRHFGLAAGQRRVPTSSAVATKPHTSRLPSRRSWEDGCVKQAKQKTHRFL